MAISSQQSRNLDGINFLKHKAQCKWEEEVETKKKYILTKYKEIHIDNVQKKKKKRKKPNLHPYKKTAFAIYMGSLGP